MTVRCPCRVLPQAVGKTLQEEDVCALLLPRIAQWSGSPDLALRAALVEHTSQFIQLIDEETDSTIVFPNLAQCFQHATPRVRELSVRSVPIIVGKLSERALNHELVKHLTMLLHDRNAARLCSPPHPIEQQPSAVARACLPSRALRHMF